MWKLPFPPPDFSAHHIFNEAHPVESELKRLRESIWGKGNESVRLRGISVARRAAMLGERVAPQPPPPPPLASRTAAFENMRAAMASRFTSASSENSGGGKGSSIGDTNASNGDLGGRLPGLAIVKPKGKSLSSQGPSSVGPTTTSPSPSILPGRPRVPTVEKPTVARQPVRSTSVWRPCPLLCKRLNAPVPEISKAVEWGRQGEEVPGTSTSSSAVLTRDLLKDVRRNEPGGSAVSKDEAAVNLKSDSSHPAKPVDSTTTTTDDKSLVDVELANRPEIDLFKSIFEAESDIESKSSESSNPEKCNDEVRVGSSTFPFSSSSTPAILPQWSSAATAMKGGEETSSTTSSDEINERHLIKGRSYSPTRRKKSKNKDSKKKHKKEGKKKKKKRSSHHKHRRS